MFGKLQVLKWHVMFVKDCFSLKKQKEAQIPKSNINFNIL